MGWLLAERDFSIEDDLRLLEDAARAGGALIAAAWGAPGPITSKGAAGPVTAVDLAVNVVLRDRLMDARPDYGWLSEETPDGPERLSKQKVFVVDPIDGTLAFIKGVPECVVSIGLVVDGAAVAGAIFNPMQDEMFTGGMGAPARRNGAAIRVTAQDVIDGATLLGKPAFYTASHWPAPWPVKTIFRHALAYRLAHLAEGGADGALLLGYKNEWDVAAGIAIVEAAGGVVSDPWGQKLTFNSPDPRLPGVVAAGPGLHPLLCARVSHTPHPRDWTSN